MFVVGLTGGIGSGKTSVAKLFAALGVTVIDTDHIARVIVQKNSNAYQTILEHFGKKILLNDETINRNLLRKIIFETPFEKKWLEDLLHPLINEELNKQIFLSKSPYCIAIIPLLFETQPNPLIDRILVVDSTPENQIKRASLRDGSSSQEIEAILKTQIERKQRLLKADDVIQNHGPMEDLKPQVDALHLLYITLAKDKP